MKTISLNAMFKFYKDERIKGKLSFHNIIVKGKKIKSFPFLFYYTTLNQNQKYPIQIGINVPKKLFKKAVHRNLLKRRMREAYRLNKYVFYNKLNDKDIKIKIIIIFIGKKIYSFNELSTLLFNSFDNLILKICEENID